MVTDAHGPWRPLSIGAAARLLASFRSRWWFSGGHALELHLGRSWRSHDDLDIGVCRVDVPRLVGPLAGWELHVAAGGVVTPWNGRELSAERQENNLWVRRHGGPWVLDLTIGDGDDEVWIYRRDPTLRLAWPDAVLATEDGTPYLAPALQLLFKSKDPRPKDDLDAKTVLPELDASSLRLLDAWLPAGHPWRSLLSQGQSR